MQSTAACLCGRQSLHRRNRRHPHGGIILVPAAFLASPLNSTVAPELSRSFRNLTNDKGRAYKSRMMNWGAQRKRSASAIIGALICFVALQSSFAFARNVEALRSHASASFEAGNYEICRLSPASDSNAPIQERHTADQCCLLCASGGRDDQPPLLFFFAVVADFLAPLTSTDVADRRVDTVDRPLTTWTSSHSSRAPPRLS
ncbi:hypothetical protein [Methylosinus sp. PW1]|uniref:hypothetical protein n=1 Tax=Methylosinus sp. PW1 TaxID=107636 RepID=UPI0018DBA1B7|nr:hypothetical protein [Methylosinus sp. PW1]